MSAGIEELESQHHLDGNLDLHYNIITYVCITIINKLLSPLAVNPKAVVSPVTQTLQSPMSKTITSGWIHLDTWLHIRILCVTHHCSGSREFTCIICMPNMAK